MRKITIIVGRGGITLIGDISEISSQLIGAGWIRRGSDHYGPGATMDEVKSFIRMYGDPSSACERYDKNVTLREDTRGNVVVEGDTSSIKDQLTSAGGIWSPRSHSWTFQRSSRDTIDAIVRNLVNDDTRGTKVIELSWNTPASPLHFRESPIFSSSRVELTDANPISPPFRRFSGDLPTAAVDSAISRDGTGNIVSISGIPVPGVADEGNVTCGLCGGHGHTRTDCICPFCRYINRHNPKDCPSK